MNNGIRKQIFDSLNQKDTDALVEIWQTNDRVEWTETAFDIIREILLERLEELPPQDEPVFEHIDQSEIDDMVAEDIIEEILLDEENAPIFYRPKQVMQLIKWINRAAIAAVFIEIISGLAAIPVSHNTIWGSTHLSPNTNPILYLLAWVMVLILFALGVAIQCVIYYFPLKALASILKILMDMEFHSRGVE